MPGSSAESGTPSGPWPRYASRNASKAAFVAALYVGQIPMWPWPLEPVSPYFAGSPVQAVIATLVPSFGYGVPNEPSGCSS